MSDDTDEQETVHECSALDDGGTSFLSRIFEALRHPRRRYILYYLRDHERAHINDLATHLATWEQDIPTGEVAPDDVSQVKASLVHTHLPKLEDYDLLEYDRRSGVASYTRPPSFLENVLDLATTLEKHL